MDRPFDGNVCTITIPSDETNNNVNIKVTDCEITWSFTMSSLKSCIVVVLVTLLIFDIYV